MGCRESEGFPARLEAALRADGYAVEVIDAGVSGDTTAGGLARLPWLLGGPPESLPDAVMVELGGNDGLRGLDPQAMHANLDAILTLLADRGVPALLTGMKAPPNLGAEYGRAFEAVFHRLADKHDVPLYPFFLEGVAAGPEAQPAGRDPSQRRRRGRDRPPHPAGNEVVPRQPAGRRRGEVTTARPSSPSLQSAPADVLGLTARPGESGRGVVEEGKQRRLCCRRLLSPHAGSAEGRARAVGHGYGRGRARRQVRRLPRAPGRARALAG